MNRLEELKSQILIAPHPDMEPHVERGAFIVIDPSLDLAEVAHLMETNNALVIQDLLTQKLLHKSAPSDIQDWRDSKTFFRFLIVQPFVVGQVVTELGN